jgi:hypothetical protein
MAALKFLDHEVALLLAKYGKKAVLDALARNLQFTPEQIEAILQKSLRDKSATHPRKRPSAADLIAQLAQTYPNKAQFLRTLHGRFANRAFLVRLADVKRFFEQHDRPLGRSKSRAELLPKVLLLLAELDAAELEALCQALPESEYSSLGAISDEILRRDR